MTSLPLKIRLVAIGVDYQALVQSGASKSSDDTASSYSFDGYNITRHRPAGASREDRNPVPSRKRGESTWVPREGHLRDESSIPEPGPRKTQC